MYQYKAEIVRWIDGDTVELKIHLGFDISIRHRCRVYGVDTPERGKPNYAEAAAFCAAHLPVGTIVTIDTRRDGVDKYGRYLATLPVGNTTISALLIEAKLGVAYFGGTKQAQPI